MNNFTLKPEILSSPNIPKPLHGLNPRTIKGQGWWDITRQQAYQSTDYHCIACGVHKTEAKDKQWLEAHEDLHIDYKTGACEVRSIVPLCHYCHNFIHSGRLYVMTTKGQISMDKAIEILQHGIEILKINNLRIYTGTNDIAEEFGLIKLLKEIPIFTPPIGVKWDKWHLVLDGKEYYSKFKDMNEWHSFYNK